MSLTQLELISKLHQHLNTSITYCHWKSTDHFNETLLAVTDLDILICKEQIKMFENEISDLGFKELKTVHFRSYPGIKDFVGLDIQSGKWVHIHAHYTLNLGDRWVKSYHLPIEGDILKRRYFDKNFNTYLINPKDELFLFRIRMSLKFLLPYKRKRVLQEEEFLRKKIDFESYSKDQYISTPFNAKVISIDNSQSLKRILLSLKLRFKLKFFQRIMGLKFSIYSQIRKLYRYYIEFRRRVLQKFDIGRRTLPEGGYIIVLTGIDGSGKTSNIIALEKFLKIHLNTTRVFLGYGSSGANWIRQIVFAIYGKKRRESVGKNAESKNKRKITFLYAIWILICLFDKKKNLKKAHRDRANGNIVLSDRWPQSKITGTFDGSRLGGYVGSNRLIKTIKYFEEKIILLSELVKPDLVIKLTISPETSAIRKPGELSLDEASRLSNIFKDLHWSCKSQKNLNAENSQDKVQKELKDLIWNFISKK